MALNFKDRVWMTTPTVGAGTLTLGTRFLGGLGGYLTFAEAGINDQDIVHYVIIDGINMERGSGTYTAAGTTLTRTVISSLIAGVSGTTLLTLSGNASIFITAFAADLALRDINSNISTNNFISSSATTVTSSGTTTLTVSSAPTQYFTGTTGQTIVLPVVATLANNQSYTLINNSTEPILVEASGSATVKTIGAGGSAKVSFNGTAGTGAASWSVSAVSPAFTNTASFNASDVILPYFPNYTSIDGLTVVTDNPLGNTTIQTNGFANYQRVHAANISPGNGGLGVNFFGAMSVEGQGISSSSTSAGWFANAAIADDHTPGHYYSSTTFRQLIGNEMDFYNFHDDTTVVGHILAGNSWVKPSVSYGYSISNLSNVVYWTGTTNNTTTISALTNAANIRVNSTIVGAGIPVKTYVVSVNVGAATMVISQAATASASGVVFSSSIPWDYGFISNDGATTNALIVGALDGNAASIVASNSQNALFIYKDSSGIRNTVTVQADSTGVITASAGFGSTFVRLSGATSGFTYLEPQGVASGTVFLPAPAVSDILVGRATTDTLTNKTFVAPVLGAATATSINKVALTAPATGSTLTIADGKTLTANNSITLAGTDATTMTFPTTSAAIARTDGTNTFIADQNISSASGPNLNITNTTAPGVANQYSGIYGFFSKNSSSASKRTGYLASQILTVTAGSESAVFGLATIQAGTENVRLLIGAGIYTPSATGGDKGSDTVNALTFYESGTSLASKYAQLGTANTFVGAVLSSTAAGGVGYATGAGGAVTQITSRTTGVTLNKITGSITLFSAAGLVTATTFTVTNNSVAATDIIVLNQKSGTNLYNLLVTAVAAGSFNITFFTTGGVATDSPVINFAVIKGVTS